MAWDDVVVDHVTKHWAANYNAMVAYIKGHKTQHENGGVDEISVAGLSGQLADGQTPLAHKTSHQNGGSDELDVTGLSGQLADGQPTISHKVSHQNGGSDEISVAGLSGQLADGQTPLPHASTHASGSTDVITILMAQVTGLVAALAGKEPAIAPKNTAFNKNYGTTATDVKMNGTQGVGSTDAVARIDHIHPQDTSRIPVHANVTTINGDGIADDEIAVFNLTSKDIRTSDKKFVTTLGADDTTVPTSKAVKTVTDLLAPIASPTLTGDPKSVTPAVDDNDTSIATTAFIQGQKGASNPLMDGTAAPGSSTKWSAMDHVHPIDTSRAPTVSPTFTGTPIAPTAADGTSTTQIATTEFVETAITDRATRTVGVVSIYVDSGASGSGTGIDWTNAFTTLSAALLSLPTVLEDAITIYVKKGSTAYVEDITLSQIVGKGSLTIRGEYYWNGRCAAAATPSTTKFNMTAADGANIEVGDTVLVTSGIGGTGAYTYFSKTTVKAVTLVSGTTWEIEINAALDSGNIGTTEYYTIAKTEFTGVFTIQNQSVVNLIGLIIHSTARTLTVNTSAAVYTEFCFYSSTASLCWFVESGGVVTTEACYVYSPYTVIYTSIGGTIRAGYSSATVSVYHGKVPISASYGSLIYVAHFIACISVNSGYGLFAGRTAFVFTAGGTITIGSGVTSTIGVYQDEGGFAMTASTVNNVRAAIASGGDDPKAYTPTLAWSTATPTSITTIARTWRWYTTIYFTIDISSADGNGTTGLTITLPKTPTNNGNIIPCSAEQLNNATWTWPGAYILADGSNNKINFRKFTTVASGNAINIHVSGHYETGLLP